jgi:hypothetical protein
MGIKIAVRKTGNSTAQFLPWVATLEGGQQLSGLFGAGFPALVAAAIRLASFPKNC